MSVCLTSESLSTFYNLDNVKRTLGRQPSGNFFFSELRVDCRGWCRLDQRSTSEPHPASPRPLYFLFWDKVLCDSVPGETWAHIVPDREPTIDQSQYRQSPPWWTEEFISITHRTTGKSSLTGTGRLHHQNPSQHSDKLKPGAPCRTRKDGQDGKSLLFATPYCSCDLGEWEWSLRLVTCLLPES